MNMRKELISTFMASILLASPQVRQVNVDFDSDLEAIVHAELADQKNRLKFPSRKKRLQARQAGLAK
jgi:hypothetical protein